MPIEANEADVGSLFDPVAVGAGEWTADASFLACLITAEVALTRAWSQSGIAPPSVGQDVSDALGWQGAGEPCGPVAAGPSAPALGTAALAGGNPVIPLVPRLRDAVPGSARAWVHRGATSQDILDSALMLLSRRAAQEVLRRLRRVEVSLSAFAADHRDLVAAARTLTQHAVPTTVGARAAAWVRTIRRATARLDAASAHLPAQLGGAAGTLASFVEIGGRESAQRLPVLYAAELALRAPEAPWHTERWPVTELGDALTQAIDALGAFAADVATLSRTEIGELSQASAGGSSAMPQKQNPTAAVLIRSAAIRAPHLAATLHGAQALAVDERPDGAWHVEWPALRDLLELALGASERAAELSGELRVDPTRVAANLAMTDGLIVAERLSLRLGDIIGRDRLADIIASAGEGEHLADLLRDEAAVVEAGIDVDSLLDPAGYLGLAPDLVDRTIGSPDTDAQEDA